MQFSASMLHKSAYDHEKNYESKTVHIKENNYVYLYDTFAHCSVDQSSNGLGQIMLVKDFEILNASGTLYLVNK